MNGDDRGGPVAPAHGAATEFSRLERRLARERQARREAETIAERATRELYCALQDTRRRGEQLAEAQENLAITLHSIGDGVIVTDVAGRVTRMNPVAEAMTGWPSAEALGRPLAEVYRIAREDTDEPLPNPAERVLREGRIIGLANHTVLARRGGGRSAIANSGAPIRDAAGRIVGVVVVFRDETERKQMEAHVAASNRMASVGTLAAGIAHEINNPLAYILANLDLVARQLAAHAATLPPDVAIDLQEMVADARLGADRVRLIVRDVKTFSRVDEERREPVELRKVLDTTAQMAATELRHRARLEKDYGDAPPVLANEGRLGQIFLNLVVNAAHAIGEGSADRNTIRLVTGTAPDGAAFVEVRDTGAGIPAPTLARIFDPFFTTKPVGVGTGLGLSICQSLVAQLGGSISVESEVGAGTTFRVTLPAHVATATAPGRTVCTVRDAAPSARRRILLIDDDAIFARTFRRTLEPEHEVVTATSGLEGLDRLLGEEDFDLVFCDLMMPNMTGMDVHESVRERRPSLADRFVFMTGGAFTARARTFLDTVANPRIEKPLDEGAVGEVLSSSRWSRPAA